MTRKALALGALIALLACGSAQASDNFTIRASGDQFWGPQTGGVDPKLEAATQLEADGTMTDDRGQHGRVQYHLQAGPGIARVSLDGSVTGSPGVPFNPQLEATAATELTVSPPAGDPTFELNVSLNLHVDGIIKSTVCSGPCGTLAVTVRAPTSTTAGEVSEFNALGETRSNGLGLAIDPVPGGYRVHGDVTSKPFGVRVNTPTPIGIVLDLGGRFGGIGSGEAFAGTFHDPAQRFQVSFAPRGPVLNVPPGYDVTGSAVVNNRWDDPFSDDTVVSNCQSPLNATTIPGSLVLRCNGATFPNLTHIGGDLVIDGNAGDGDLDLGDVSVGGAVDVSGNGGDLDIGIGSVAGTVDISGTGGDLDVGIGSVAGTVDISGTGGDLDVGIGSTSGTIDISGTGGDLDVGIGSTSGTIDISGTGGDLAVDPGTVSGDLDLSDNPDAGVVDVGAGQIGGDLTITDDGTAVVDANDSLTVSGDANVETDGGGMLDLSGLEADGDETVVADGADGVSANTAGGTTDVSVGGGTAALHATLPDGAFDQPVAFTITRRGDDPAQGAVDPVAGYAFAFAVPALNADARLAFTVDLASLDAATRAALLAGIASGAATIATKADDPGAAYSAFPRCAGAQTPEADHCVAVTLLAADGSVAPAGTDPAFARFDGVAGHFSTYAVALVSRPASTPPGGGPPAGGSPLPGSSRPTRAQIRALLLSQITPRGRAGRIGSLLSHGYRLSFRALTAGTAKVAWYRVRKGRKPVLIASGRRRFAAAGRATLTVRLAAAGRRQLRRARHLKLTAKGTFTPAPGAPVTATRTFTLRR
jgi:hypothetical protein